MAFIFVMEKWSKRKKKHKFYIFRLFVFFFNEYWKCGIVPWFHCVVAAVEPMSSSGEMEKFWLQDSGSSHILREWGLKRFWRSILIPTSGNPRKQRVKIDFKHPEETICFLCFPGMSKSCLCSSVCLWKHPQAVAQDFFLFTPVSSLLELGF